MGPPGKWLAMMADEYLPGRVTGRLDVETVTFTHAGTDKTYTFAAKDGWLDARGCPRATIGFPGAAAQGA